MKSDIIKGDCLDIMRNMPDKNVDLILTDPPYDFDDDRKKELHNEFVRVSKNGVIVFSPPENQWMKSDQYGFWIKPISTKNTTKHYSRFVEMVFFYGDLKWRTGRHWSQYTNVFNDLVEGETTHPFEKPISLIKRLILNHSDKDDLIFDPFCGSGTTCFVSKSLGRKYLGVEISDEYYKISLNRLKK